MTHAISLTQIKSWGNSLAIRIPKQINELFSLKDGSKVRISIDNDKIIIEREDNEFLNLAKNKKLSDLTSKINEDNMHNSSDYFDDSNPVGKEVW